MTAEAPLTDLAAPVTFAELLRPGRRAVAKYWRPFLLIQACAVAAVAAYFKVPAAAAAFEHLSQLKRSGGLLGSGLAGGLAGVLLPEIAKTIALGDRRFDGERWRTMGFHFCFFCLNSMAVDMFYRSLTVLFGDRQTPGIIVAKLLIDQLVFTPLWALPFGATAFALRAHHYNVPALVRGMNWNWAKHHIVPLLPPNWFYWIPMTVLVYALPSKLQFVLFLFAMAAWSLVLVFIASGEGEKDPKVDPELVPAITAPEKNTPVDAKS